MNLEGKTLDRKARLAAIRAQKNQQNAPKINFRNYTPSTTAEKEDEEQDQETQEEAAIESKENNLRNKIDTIEKEALEFGSKAVKEEAERNKDVDLFNLAPKKPNWDLKRDLESKLEDLEAETKICIAELARERLKAEGKLAE